MASTDEAVESSTGDKTVHIVNGSNGEVTTKSPRNDTNRNGATSAELQVPISASTTSGNTNGDKKQPEDPEVPLISGLDADQLAKLEIPGVGGEEATGQAAEVQQEGEEISEEEKIVEPVNIVHQHKIWSEMIHKELKHQQIYTNFTINSVKKIYPITGKPNTVPDEIEQEDDGVAEIISRAYAPPHMKYLYAQTEAQEYGWFHNPLEGESRSDSRLHNPRVQCDITRYAESAMKLKAEQQRAEQQAQLEKQMEQEAKEKKQQQQEQQLQERKLKKGRKITKTTSGESTARKPQSHVNRSLPDARKKKK